VVCEHSSVLNVTDRGALCCVSVDLVVFLRPDGGMLAVTVRVDHAERRASPPPWCWSTSLPGAHRPTLADQHTAPTSLQSVSALWITRLNKGWALSQRKRKGEPPVSAVHCTLERAGALRRVDLAGPLSAPRAMARRVDRGSAFWWWR
jgi:hypothetical protein